MKAILVIDDMPNSCDECEVRCGGYTAKEYAEKGIKKPSWCPLKPMPEKLYVEANSIEDVMPSEFDMDKFILKIRLDADKLCALGWNACLDDITGETK